MSDRVLILSFSHYEADSGNRIEFRFYDDYTYRTSNFYDEEANSRWKIENGMLYYKHESMENWKLWENPIAALTKMLDVDAAIEEMLASD